MATGLGRLRLSPDQFWRLSLPEWRACIEPIPTDAGLDRAGFAALCARYPDR